MLGIAHSHSTLPQVEGPVLTSAIHLVQHVKLRQKALLQHVQANNRAVLQLTSALAILQ